MALADRNPTAGTQLAANYKKVRYACEVVLTNDGLRYRLYGFTKTDKGYQPQDGTHVDFKTPSAAGSTVLGGQACNGWRFWSLATDLDAPKERKPRKQKAEAGEPQAESRRVRVVFRMDDQEGVAANQVKYWCSACQEAFTVPASITPQGCPKGHAALAPNCELQTVAV